MKNQVNSTSKFSLLVVRGDWSGIRMSFVEDGSGWDFVPPSSYIVDFFTTPPVSELPSNLADHIILDLEEAIEEIVSGDQNGSILAPRDPIHLPSDPQAASDIRNGVIRILLDSEITPEEFREFFQETLDGFNSDPGQMLGEVGMALDVLQDESANEKFTPRYIAHCRKCLETPSSTIKTHMEKFPIPLVNLTGPSEFLERALVLNIH